MKFDELKAQVLSDPETKRAYDEMEGEYEAMRALHAAKAEAKKSKNQNEESSEQHRKQ